MTNKNSTRRALFASVIAMILCFTMLLGTTFAWFTDSVTSGKNTIVSGNLDIELEYSKDMSTWSSVQGKSDLFDPDALWEPGHVEVVYLKISNLGTLALKYNFAMNIVNEVGSTNVNGEDFKLSEYLKYAVVDVTEKFTDRDAALAEVEDDAIPLANYTTSGEMLKGAAAKTIAIVVYMPTNVGNEANYAKGAVVPTIDLGISLVATQYTAEEDSYGNTYDSAADFPIVSALVPVVANTPVTLKTEGDSSVEMDLPAEVVDSLKDSGVESVALAHTEPKIEVNGDSAVITFDSIELVDQNGDIIDMEGNTTPMPMTLPAVPAIANKTVAVCHDGVVIATATADSNGVVEYAPVHLCEVTIIPAVTTAEELKAAVANGGKVALANDITTAETINVTKDIVIYGNERTLTYTGSNSRVIDVQDNGADLTVKDLDIKITSTYCQRGINYGTNGILVLDNVKLGEEGTKATYGINLPGKSDNAKVEIINCDIVAHIALNVWGENSVINVTNSDLSNYDTTEVENYSTVVLNSDGTTSAEGTVINVNGGSIVAYDQNNEEATAIRNGTLTGSVNVSDTTTVVGDIVETVAVVRYLDANGDFYTDFYGCSSLQSAINKAAESKNAVVVLIKDIDLIDDPIVIAKDVNVILDLGGKVLSGKSTSNTTSYLIKIEAGGALTLQNGKVSFYATKPDVEWGGEGQPAYPGYANNTISNVGTLVVNDVTIENLTAAGGASYAIDCYQGSDLTVNEGAVINGHGKTAIRMFANSNTLSTNVTIEGGTITGSRAVWVHLPGSNSSNVRPVNLTINGGKLISTVEDGLCIYSYSYGDSFAGTNITITGGEFTGSVDFGGGYKGDTENVKITGGTFHDGVGRWVTSDKYEPIEVPTV